LVKGDNLIQSFIWLKENKAAINEHLAKIIPDYHKKLIYLKNEIFSNVEQLYV